MKIHPVPAHEADTEFDTVHVEVDLGNRKGPSVDLYLVRIPHDHRDAEEIIELTPGGAVLLAEQLLKAARKAAS